MFDIMRDDSIMNTMLEMDRLMKPINVGLPQFARYPTGYNRPHSRSIAQRNRWTGKPHENKREIARRLRQAARHATPSN